MERVGDGGEESGKELRRLRMSYLWKRALSIELPCEAEAGCRVSSSEQGIQTRVRKHDALSLVLPREPGRYISHYTTVKLPHRPSPQ
jgi:hypothetical protein